ncbi:complement C1q-like protein 2 [Saccostrea echinata]|uniref:complement C1q-like protein 2 n=1 Tax=Saccostrea echinata TaxID=191078 RepID=UPI002A83855B|nr:complement C1q-like protein 2 [Saccostrea echinata]
MGSYPTFSPSTRSDVSMNRNQCDLSTKVAFSAGATSVSSTWNKGVLIFPRVISNAGGGYNPSTGVFTAPTTGHYAFFANVQSYGSSSIFADIVLNGLSKVRTVASSNGNESYEAGPNMVVLALQRGDRVWVRRHSGAGYVSHQDAPVTTFSGFLI